MPQGAYPISRFLRQIITDSGLRRSEFVQAIGYKNAAKGLRRLDEWLQNGSGDEGCLQKIIDAFHPDPTALEHALAKTERIHHRDHDEAVREIEERERRRFKPFVWVHTVNGAHSFLTAVAERQVKVLWMLESFENLSEPAKLGAIQRRVREHYQKTGGKYIGFFGRKLAPSSCKWRTRRTRREPNGRMRSACARGPNPWQPQVRMLAPPTKPRRRTRRARSLRWRLTD